MRPLAFALLVAAQGQFAFAQTFAYELLDVSRSPARTISRGSINIDSSPQLTSAPEGTNSKVIRRELGIPGGWAVGCTDYREASPKGFGCWLARRPSAMSVDKYDGFSWEWFDLEAGETYIKRQGGSRVTLKQSMDNGLPSFTSLHFLDEAIFSANVGPIKAGKETHELRILRGSVLPLSNTQVRQ